MAFLSKIGNLFLLLTANIAMSMVGFLPTVALALLPLTTFYTLISYFLMQKSKGYIFNLGVNFAVLMFGLIGIYSIGQYIILLVVMYNSLGALLCLLLMPHFFLKLEK